ncbi:MAG TPA: hypothetical protein VLB89_07000 [Gaiellaceae bacterium]|nr:hypothetical protein [Gaiellaceae bacterium]
MLAAPTIAPAQTTAARAAPFKATLTASGHRPVALTAWRYTLRVTDLQGRPIRARAVFKIVFVQETPPPPRVLARVSFRGRARGLYRWPSLLRGEPLEFQSTVTAKGATLTLRYRISVR